jgi:hypothetical protein
VIASRVIPTEVEESLTVSFRGLASHSRMLRDVQSSLDMTI